MLAVMPPLPIADLATTSDPVVETYDVFSRAIPFSKDSAQPGDRINVANDDQPPYWQTLIAVVACDDAPEDEGDCDGDCAFVLHLKPGAEGEYDVEWWHVSWTDAVDITTSLPAAAR